jgi:hypothetical protein
MKMIHAAFACAAECWQSYVLPRAIQIEAWLQCRLDRLASARDARLMEGGIEINATVTKVRAAVGSAAGRVGACCIVTSTPSAGRLQE